MLYEERTEESQFFRMQYITQRQQSLSIFFQYFKGGYKEDENSIFHIEETRGNGYKLLLEIF